jgi:hypothetical protein
MVGQITPLSYLLTENGAAEHIPDTPGRCHFVPIQSNQQVAGGSLV